jgi:chromosomal replication initiation ATPase DnaA
MDDALEARNMDALRQSVLRAQMAKPLPGGTPPNRSQKAADTRIAEMIAIAARFSTLDKKLDTVIDMLTGASGGCGALLPADIRRVVTDFFNVTDEELDHHGRSGRIPRIRQIAFYLCRKHTMLSLPEIGRAFHRDHSTISHGERRIGALRKIDAALHSDLLKLEARLADVLAHRRRLISSGT